MLTRFRALVLALGLAVAAFAPSLGAGFLWDDFQLFVRNERLHAATLGQSLRQAFWETSEPLPQPENYYRPVVRGALWLQWRWFGENPAGYHFVNILLHGLCAVMVAALCLRRLNDAPESPRLWAALAAAMLFALHPSRVESVGWISGSTDLWMTAWLLAGALLWTPRLSVRLGISCACFVLALFAKETAIVVPAILLLDILCLSASEKRRDSFRAWALVTLALGAALVVRILMAPMPRSTSKIFDSFFPRVLATVGEYAARTVWPWPVAFMWTSASPEDIRLRLYVPWVIALGAIVVALTLVLAIVALRRRALAPWVADLGWYFLPLAPVANLIPFDRPFLSGSRFLYLPMVGLSLVLGRVVSRAPQSFRVGMGAAAVALGLAYCLTVWPAQAHLRDETALWQHEANVNPNNRSANENFARVMVQQKKPEQAIPYFQRALQASRQPSLRARLVLQGLYAEISATSDNEQKRLLELKAALDEFETGKALLRWPLRSGEVLTAPVDAALWGELRKLPDIGDYFGFRGMLCMRTGDTEGAVHSFREAVVRTPRHPGPRRSIMGALAAAGRWDEALEAFDETRKVLSPQPWFTAWGSALGVASAAAKARPQTLETAVAQANVLTLLGVPVYARRVLEPFRAENEGHLLFQQAEARADLRARHYARARETLERAAAAHPEARNGLMQAIEEVNQQERRFAGEL